jgi:drug/metabolite transporter (DMT)-like permease
MNRAYVALLLAALSWGLALTAADAALAEISATDLLFLETAAGTAVVVVACWVTGRRVNGAWRPAVVLGSLEPGIAYVFANVGLILTSAAVGSMLFALESVFVVMLAAVLLRTRPRRVEISALGLGVLGTVMVASAQTGGRSSGMGVAIMIVSTLLSAGYVLAAKRFADGNEPIALVARQGLASLVVTAPFILGASLNGGSRLGTASLGCILLACLTGVIGFAIPYTLWTTSLPHVRPGFAAVALNLVPLVGVISATLLGQGGLNSGQWAGGGLILVGLVLLTRAEMAAPSEEPTAPSVPAPIAPPTVPVRPAPLAVPVPRTPVEPIGPTPRVPLQPAASRVPVQPAAARVPFQPAASWVPLQSTGPRTPVQPAASRVPVQPAASRVPVQPAASRVPVQPAASRTPVQPAGPRTPVQPAASRRPVQPAGPRPPVQPAGPRTPTGPAGPTAPIPLLGNGLPAAPARAPQPVAPVPVVPAQRRPGDSAPSGHRPGIPGPRSAEAPLPERIRAVADAGMRRLRAEQDGAEQNGGEQDGERHRLRPGRARQPIPTAGQRAAARSDVPPGHPIPAQREHERAHESLVGWLRGQQDVDSDVDVEAIAAILTGAITHYQAITDGQEADPFGIEEDRYLSAVAELAAASLTR